MLPRQVGTTGLRAAVAVLLACLAVLAGCSQPSADTPATPPPPQTLGPDFAPIKPGEPTQAKTIDATLVTADGQRRTYHLYVPPSIKVGKTGSPVPLLVALHGGIGWGTQFERNSGFSQLAQANRFIVVYPDGVGAAGTDVGRTWNGGNCCGPAVRRNINDVGFINQLIVSIERQFPIDRRRVFAAGHSNGGIMSYRLACQLSDQIVAIGSQSGPIGVQPCKPAKPVSLLHIHGTADDNVPIEGGGGSGLANVEFVPARLGPKTFARADGCSAKPSETTWSANREVAIAGWPSCADGTAVLMLTVTGATHAWMGHDAQAPALTGPAYTGLDSSAAIWSFLSAHPRR